MQQHLGSRLPAQQRALVGHAQRIHAVDAGDHLALFDERSGRASGGAGRADRDRARRCAPPQTRRPSRRAAVAPPAWRGPPCRPACAHRRRTRTCAAPKARPPSAQSRHSAHRVRHAIHQRHIPVAHRRPVHPVHVRVVEIVALHPPRIQKDPADIVSRIRRDTSTATG